MTDSPIKCTRCRHAHTEDTRVSRPRSKTPGIQVSDTVCPRCGCKSYYDCTPQVAWCWASGLIEIGDTLPADSPDGGGAIQIAQGPKFALKGRLGALARHGQGASEGKLLVPGVPEAATSEDKCNALEKWLSWCGRRKNSDGITFSKAGA